MSLLPQPIMAFGTDFAFAEATFTETGTTTPVAVYQDFDYGTPHASPVVANAVGQFPAIYLDPSLGDVRMRVVYEAGNLALPVLDIDPLNVLFGLGGVTNAYLADAPGGTLKGNLTGGTGPVTDYDQDAVTDFVRYATDTEAGTTIFASDAETIAGALADKSVTPASLLAALTPFVTGITDPLTPTSTLAAKGHYVFPGGLIVQWGTEAPGDDAQTEYNLDMAFTTTFYGAVATVKYNGAKTGGNGGGATWYPSGLNKIKLGIAWDGDSTGITTVSYLAWGK